MHVAAAVELAPKVDEKKIQLRAGLRHKPEKQMKFLHSRISSNEKSIDFEIIFSKSPIYVFQRLPNIWFD